MNIASIWFSFEGRISRFEFWLKGIVPLFLFEVLIVYLTGSPDLAVAVVLLPAFAISIKRFHDRDKSGWWVLILFIPIIGYLWWLIECGFFKGTDGNNRFGADPLER